MEQASVHSSGMYQPIEDYAVIGDLHTIALVGKNGSSLPETISYDLWQNLRRLLEWLAEHWQEPDEGIWEVCGGPKRFVHSRLMSWVAFDRALRVTRRRGLPVPMGDWMQKSAKIYEQIMYAGWNEKKQSFVQYYGSDAVGHPAVTCLTYVVSTK